MPKTSARSRASLKLTSAGSTSRRGRILTGRPRLTPARARFRFVPGYTLWFTSAREFPARSSVAAPGDLKLVAWAADFQEGRSRVRYLLDDVQGRARGDDPVQLEPGRAEQRVVLRALLTSGKQHLHVEPLARRWCVSRR
jgi:hypothetical protein